MLGVRQSGMQAFRFARLPEDVELLERARYHAREILDADPALRAPEHALLEDAIHRAYGADALEPIPGLAANVTERRCRPRAAPGTDRSPGAVARGARRAGPAPAREAPRPQ